MEPLCQSSGFSRTGKVPALIWSRIFRSTSSLTEAQIAKPAMSVRRPGSSFAGRAIAMRSRIRGSSTSCARLPSHWWR